MAVNAGHVRRRTRKDGTVTFQARYPDPADARRRVERTFPTKREAQAWLGDQLHALRHGNHIDPRKGGRTFATVVEAWRETEMARLAPKSRERYDAVIRGYLLPEWGGTPANAITRETVKRYFARLAAERKDDGELLRRPATVRKIHTVASAVFAAAVEMDILRVNPCHAQRRGRSGLPAPDDREMLFLTAEQVRVLADAMPSADPRHPGAWARSNQLAIYMLAYGGLRAGELWALRRADVDLRGRLHVRRAIKAYRGHVEFGPTKSRKERVVSLPGFVRELLSEHLTDSLPGGAGPDALLFTSPWGEVVRHELWRRRVFVPAVKRALPEHLHGLRVHDLRHTSASLALGSGAPIKLVQERLGHASIATTMRYSHVLPGVDDDLMDRLDAAHAATAEGNVVMLRTD